MTRRQLPVPETALARTEPAAEPVDPPWRPFYDQAVYFLAGHYAAEAVRKRQIDAQARGHSLTAEEIATIFKNEAEFMTAKIQRTSKTDGRIE